jgi:hypothetical protein
MKRFILVGACAAAAAALFGATASMAASAPSGTITFHGGGVALIAGVNWGGGTLHYKGHDYHLKVSGLSVGEVGANSYNISGEVYHLNQVKDIEGTYAAGEAAATAVKGAGELEMKNGAGVLIKAHSSQSGLNLKLGPSGLTIKLKK